MSDNSHDNEQQRMDDSTSRFDKAAETWEEKPARLELAAAIAKAIWEEVPLTPEMEIMDFGCGTGLIARALAPRVRLVTAADTSAQMLAVLEAKAKEAGLEGINPLLLDETYGTHGGVAYDAIVSGMVLHHIEDIPELVAQLAQWCRPGGWLALADLEPEDGSFHHDPTGVVHHGIDPTWLADQLEPLDFTIRSTRRVHTIRRPPAQGVPARDYPVFLVAAQRRAS